MSKGIINARGPGQPSKYDPKFLKMTRDYLVSCVDGYERVVVNENTTGRGKNKKKVKFYDKVFRVNIPTIEGLSLILHVHKDTIQEWRKIHHEFSVLIGELLSLQGQMLIKNGLSGMYNPTITKVLLTKHGYREGLEHTGEGGADLFRPTKSDKDAADKALREMD